MEDVEEEEKERKGKGGVKGFALFGLLIGAAVFAAVLSVLGVGHYAYRTRQKTMRRRGRSRSLESDAVGWSREEEVEAVAGGYVFRFLSLDARLDQCLQCTACMR